jgi:CRISPR-associated protein Cas1
MIPATDLSILPRVRDSWSYLYIERSTIDQDQHAIAVRDAEGTTLVPCTMLNALLLGPGTSITHAAVHTLAAAGCSVVWVGEQGVRTYASGTGETRSARHLARQATAWADPVQHMAVVRRMYALRFGEDLDPSDTLQQIRGREGVRVRDAYARASRETGVPWRGRVVPRPGQGESDAPNRAISAANSCLYGVCHAAIVAAGYSPGLGFVHVGKQLSFVYDIADLYKVDVTVPVAFRAVAENDGSGLETRVRRACRDAFASGRLLARIVPDMDRLLAMPASDDDAHAYDGEFAAEPGGWWDPRLGEVPGGRNQAPTDDGGHQSLPPASVRAEHNA